MKAMTVGQLHKQLTKMIADGHVRKSVTISKTTFRHPCEGDGQTILPVYGLDLEWVLTGDDDGGTKLRKDGSECGSWQVVITGGSEP